MMHIVIAKLNCHSSYILLVFTSSDHNNQITDRRYIMHSIDESAVSNVSQY
jgi:hypothetical protein